MPGRRLVVVSERDHNFIDLDETELLKIGRSPDNDIIVKDDMVSRHHCQLEVGQQGLAVRIRDLKSFNGTYLNERRVRDQPLGLWDALRVGRTKMFLVERGQTALGDPTDRVRVPGGENKPTSVEGEDGTPEVEAPEPLPLEGAEAEARPAGGDEMGATKTMEIEAIASKELRGIVDEIVRREREELERQICRRIRDESGPAVTSSLEGCKVRVKRVGPSDGGGDFFDVFKEPLRDDDLFIALGSVSGVGIAACVAATAARHTLRGVTTVSAGEAPRKNLDPLREVLRQTLHPGSALSLLLARVSGGKVSVGAMGGTGALHYKSASEEVEVLRPPGRRDEEANRPEELEVVLKADDRLLLVSDGAGALRRADGEPFGSDRLKTKLTEVGSKPIKELLAGLAEEYVSFSNDTPDRDVTLLVVASVSG